MDYCFICTSHIITVISSLALTFGILVTLGVVFRLVNIKIMIFKIADLQTYKSYYHKALSYSIHNTYFIKVDSSRLFARYGES